MAKNNKFKAHQIYKLKSGERVSSVTTIIGQQLGWNKRHLINWANRIGRQGIDNNKYTDDKAAIGSLAHALCTDFVLGKKTNTDDYSANQIKDALNSKANFDAWLKGKEFKPILVEKPLVSETYRIGGTPDIVWELDGRITLTDLKTGSGVYPDMFIQVAGGYAILLEEHGIALEDIMILNIPRDKTESFIVQNIPEEQGVGCQAIFLNCVRNHYLRKEYKL